MDARERAYEPWIPAFAGMNGVATARPTSSLRRTRLRAFCPPYRCYRAAQVPHLKGCHLPSRRRAALIGRLVAQAIDLNSCKGSW